LDDFWPADLRHSHLLPEMLRGASSVIHTAGLAHQFKPQPHQASRFHSINCEATERLARTAASVGVKRFVFVSSVAVYGPARDGELRNEDTPPAPVGPYATSKRQAELRLLQIAAETGMEVFILRLGTLYGEGDPGNVGRLMEAMKRGRFVMIGPGQNKKSLLYRDDAATACIKAALDPMHRPVGIWNITGEPCSMKDIVHGISSALGKTPPQRTVPAAFASGLLWTGAALGIGPLGEWAKSQWASVQKWLADDAYDGSRFAKDFDWQPGVTLEEGLRRLANSQGSKAAPPYRLSRAA
jgi:nucleoside-diphosphate-sugar epimerase